MQYMRGQAGLHEPIYSEMGFDAAFAPSKTVTSLTARDILFAVYQSDRRHVLWTEGSCLECTSQLLNRYLRPFEGGIERGRRVGEN